MPRLADEKLVAVHETVLERWKKTKPEQYWRLHEIVRQDPVYRPLRPTETEAEFYRDRGEYLSSLPRFRLRAVYDAVPKLRHASFEIVLVEDRKRMGIYRGSVAAIRRGTVDWPTDVIEFAREAIRDHKTKHAPFEDESITEPTVEDAFSERIFELFPPSAVERAAMNTSVDEYDVYRALDELQGVLAQELPRLVREHEVEEFDDAFVVISAEENLIDDVLFGYDDDLLSAVTSVHAQSSDTMASIRATGQPLVVGVSKKAVRGVREILNRSRDASGA